MKRVARTAVAALALGLGVSARDLGQCLGARKRLHGGRPVVHSF